MKIAGVGAGPGLLTQEAISAIRSAKIIFGSKRAIEIAKEYITSRCEVHEITDYTLKSIPENAVVLSTGDPMLSGLGKFAKKDDVIITGISSMQLACARLQLDIENLSVISAHSRDLSNIKIRLASELENGKNIFLLPDVSFGVIELCEFLKPLGFSMLIYVFEHLGYPNERIIEGTIEKPPITWSDTYCIVIRKPYE